MSWGETLFLKKTIDGTKSIVASDDVYYTIISDLTETGNVQGNSWISLPYRIKFKSGNTIRIVADVATGYGGAIDEGVFECRINNVALKSGYFSENSTTNSSVVTLDIPIKKGDVLTFAVYSSMRPSTNLQVLLNSLNLCGKIIDQSLIKDITEEV